MAEMEPEEQIEFADWAWKARGRTTFDSRVIGYPRTVMFIAERDTGKMGYLPVQTTLMAEVFIPIPGASKKAIAAMLGRFDEALIDAAKATKVGDVYCYIPDTESEYATKVMRHGWKEVPDVRLFRKSALGTQ